ncbi:MAG: hypothetical protein FWB74_09800 [Defluviitaleaceae bacterium]|nr:hypothetical protein [Defluviitaleaceae bacterium]
MNSMGAMPSRKVVLLKGDRDKWYEQAIFIMRHGVDEEEIDFVKEAEKIINNQALHDSILEKYEDNALFAPPAALAAPAPAPPKEKAGVKTQATATRLDFKLNLALLIVGIGVLALFVYNFL